MLLFSRETFTLRLASEFAVLLTFGIVFPPLAIVICVAIISQTIMTQRLTSKLLVGSKATVQHWEHVGMVSNGKNVDDHDDDQMPSMTRYDLLFILFHNYFIEECSQITEFISLVIPYISVLMMIFLSFSLFDTLADSHGNEAGLIILGSLIAIPLIEYLVGYVVRVIQ